MDGIPIQVSHSESSPVDLRSTASDDMFILQYASLLASAWSFLPLNHVHARHVHRKPLHQHRAVSSPSAVAVAEPSISAGNGLVSDIQELQQGLTNLPQDLISFINSIEQRLEEVETLLEALLLNSTIVVTDLPVTPTPTSIVIPSLFTGLGPAIPPSDRTTSNTALCTPGGSGAGPLVPCPLTSETAESTITSTTRRTSTVYVPFPTGNASVSLQILKDPKPKMPARRY